MGGGGRVRGQSTTRICNDPRGGGRKTNVTSLAELGGLRKKSVPRDLVKRVVA